MTVARRVWPSPSEVSPLAPEFHQEQTAVILNQPLARPGPAPGPGAGPGAGHLDSPGDLHSNQRTVLV